MASKDDIERLFEPDQTEALRSYLLLLHPADVAELLGYVSETHWLNITSKLSPEALAEVLADLDERQREALGRVLATERLIQVVDELETDDAADVLAALPDEKSAAVLPELEDKEEIRTLLAYPEDSAGGIMQTEICWVPHDARVAEAIEAVRRYRDEVEDIHEIYVVDRMGRLDGTISLQDLVLSEPETPVAQIAEPIEMRVTADVDQEEVALLFRKYDLTTMAVVDSGGMLLGRITFDDVHDVMEEEASEDIMAMAGASTGELVYSSAFFRIALFRLPWLVASLLGSLVTTQLVPMFSKVPADTIVLASFVPVVMAMTGNVGSQSAMIITRGFAIGRVEMKNLGRTILREVAVGNIMGIAAGTIVGGFGHLWHGDSTLGLALTLSMISSMTVASFVGVAAPALFKTVGVDPAIGAGPLVTTICDVLGVSTYLLVAILVLS